MALPCESGRVKKACTTLSPPRRASADVRSAGCQPAESPPASRRTHRTPGALCRYHRSSTDFAKRMECARLAAAFERTLEVTQVLCRSRGSPLSGQPVCCSIYETLTYFFLCGAAKSPEFLSPSTRRTRLRCLAMQQPRNHVLAIYRSPRHSKRSAQFVRRLGLSGLLPVRVAAPQSDAPTNPGRTAREGAAGDDPRKPAEAHGRSRKPKNVFHAVKTSRVKVD